MTALELAAALLTPDSPVLPAERRVLYFDCNDDVWATHGNDLHYVCPVTGFLDVMPWDRELVELHYGPLREVAP